MIVGAAPFRVRKALADLQGGARLPCSQTGIRMQIPPASQVTNQHDAIRNGWECHCLKTHSLVHRKGKRPSQGSESMELSSRTDIGPIDRERALSTSQMVIVHGLLSRLTIYAGHDEKNASQSPPLPYARRDFLICQSSNKHPV